MKRISEIINNLFADTNLSAIGGVNVLTEKGEFAIDAYTLIEKYPPRFSNQYKHNLWAKICSRYGANKQSLPDNPIIVSQYNGDLADIDVNMSAIADTEIGTVDYYFDYAPSNDSVTRWYLNFADPNLFVAYGTDLFAQDEIQCIEHPLLGAIKEYLLRDTSHGVTPLTITNGVPTPVLLENVPYMVDVRTDVDKDGSVYSIYGNAFSYAELYDSDILDEAIRIKDEITESNIIAMCAPCPESGTYRLPTIDYIVKCAVVGFTAAKERSKTPQIEIHTGRWGAGAFGGNEELALLVQVIAAKIAGVHRLIFHAVNKSKLDNAMHLCEKILNRDVKMPTLTSIVESIYNIGYKWGISDGN